LLFGIFEWTGGYILRDAYFDYVHVDNVKREIGHFAFISPFIGRNFRESFREPRSTFLLRRWRVVTTGFDRRFGGCARKNSFGPRSRAVFLLRSTSKLPNRRKRLASSFEKNRFRKTVGCSLRGWQCTHVRYITIPPSGPGVRSFAASLSFTNGHLQRDERHGDFRAQWTSRRSRRNSRTKYFGPFVGFPWSDTRITTVIRTFINNNRLTTAAQSVRPLTAITTT